MTKSLLQATVADPAHFGRLGENTSNDRLASARGVARLYDATIRFVRASLDAGHFRLKISVLVELHRIAYGDLDEHAGAIRSNDVMIANSSHRPPHYSQAPVLLEEMCDYVNDNWDIRSPLHLAAYVLWRVLWIHPFFEGNGVVSRALSYVVLSVREGCILPGRTTIPEQIASNREGYYRALEAADRAWSAGVLDLTELEALMAGMLERQLASSAKD